MNTDSTNRYLSYFSPFAGVIGCLTIIYGMFESVTHYTRSCCYSPKNHFISELGLANASTMAHVFDHSVMVAGLLLLLFIVGLGSYLKHSKTVHWATLIGMIATLSFSAVGYFNASHWLWHKITAIIFFTGAMIAMVLFSYEMWRHQESKLYHSILMWISGATAMLYFVVLFWPKATFTEYIYHPDQFIRPEIWPMAIMEWVYCLLICFWILMVSVRLGRQLHYRQLPQSLLESYR